jgi:hypothetical protein
MKGKRKERKGTKNGKKNIFGILSIFRRLAKESHIGANLWI